MLNLEWLKEIKMAKEEKDIEFIDQKAEQKELKKTFFKDLITGSMLVKESFTAQTPYFLFLVGIAVFYIGNRYHAEKVYRTKMELQTEIEELRAESITTASELMFLSKRSGVNKLIREKGLDLNESTEPPKIIK